VLGEYNTFNGSHYVPYVYTANNHSVRYAGHVLTLYDWYTVLSNETDVLVEDMRWIVQYWQEQAGGRWAELDLWEHSFLTPVFSGTLMKLGQRFSDGSASLDVWYIVRNCDQMKVLLNFTAGVTNEYHFVWQLTGVEGTPTYLNQSLQFEDVNVGWGDTDINATYEYSAVGRKCDILFDPIVTEAGSFYVLDPSVNPVMGSDGDDDWWSYNWPTEGSWNHWDTNLYHNIYNFSSTLYIAQERFSLSIPQGATINSANLSMYEYTDNAARVTEIRRINEVNVGDLESDTVKPIADNSTVCNYVWNGSAEHYGIADVTDIVQDQVNLGGWSSGYYVGFVHWQNVSSGTGWKWYDYCASAPDAYMNVTYTEAGGNNAPVNDQTPTLDNADDTDNMYAQYREYQMTVYVSDADGFADIDYLEVSLWDDGQSTEYFRFRYDEDTDTFTEEYDSGTVVSLNTGSNRVFQIQV